MPSTVFFGSARQARLEASESLPAKLELILDRLHLRDRVKDERVAIKMHIGNNVGYSTIHPVFVRKVVQAVREGGGEPFVADVFWDEGGARLRGYSSEVLGCPVYPAAGPGEATSIPHVRPYKNIREWNVAGTIQDATFLVNFAHVKGHPTCGYGAALKNLALGCMAGRTRGEMHDTMHFDPYWFPERCSDPETIERSPPPVPSRPSSRTGNGRDTCTFTWSSATSAGAAWRSPRGKPEDPGGQLPLVHGSLRHRHQRGPVHLRAWPAVHLNLATFMTPLCDCYGFTTLPILPDAGIFGSDDMVAVDQAVLDMTGRSALMEEAVPLAMEVHFREGHPFRQLHGPFKDPYLMTEYAEEYGLGTRDYELVDVYPLVTPERAGLPVRPLGRGVRRWMCWKKRGLNSAERPPRRSAGPPATSRGYPAPASPPCPPSRCSAGSGRPPRPNPGG
jgi:uncharacterized protein